MKLGYSKFFRKVWSTAPLSDIVNCFVSVWYSAAQDFLSVRFKVNFVNPYSANVGNMASSYQC